MGRIFLVLFAAAIGLTALSDTRAAEPRSQKYALLVAVTKYSHAEMNKPELKFPEADARALGEYLKQSGYEVDYLLGNAAKRTAILAALDKFNTKGGDGGVVVVGLFGHGVEANFSAPEVEPSIEGCYCPVDTSIRQAVDKAGKKLFREDGQPLVEPVPESLVRFSEILGALKLSAANSRVVFADCCREMPNRARGRNLGLGASFKAKDLPDNTAVMFGCAPGKKSYERDDWGHGAFTKCLIEEMKTLSTQGEVTTGTLGDRVKRRVKAITGGADPQEPQPFQVDSIDLQLVAAGMSEGEIALRKAKAARVLDSVERALAASPEDGVTEIGIKAKNWSNVAWTWARMGNRQRSLAAIDRAIPAVEDVTNFEGIGLCRVLGLLRQQRGSPDLLDRLERIKAAEEKRQIAFFGEAKPQPELDAAFRAPFGPEPATDALTQLASLEAVVDDDTFDTDSCRILLDNPKLFLAPAARDVLRQRLAKTKDVSARLVLAAFAGDRATIESILQAPTSSTRNSETEVKAGTSLVGHSHYWVVPYGLRGEIDEPRQLTKSRTALPALSPLETVLFAEAALDAGHLTQAKSAVRDLANRIRKGENTGQSSSSLFRVIESLGIRMAGTVNDFPNLQTFPIRDVVSERLWLTLGRIDADDGLLTDLGLDRAKAPVEYAAGLVFDLPKP